MALSHFDVESAGSGMFGYRTERDDGPAVRLSHRWIGLLLGERGGVVRGRIYDMHRSRDQNLSRVPGKRRRSANYGRPRDPPTYRQDHET